jgi:membrane-anchored protein YejM (alkaline phosphatase superfamily)
MYSMQHIEIKMVSDLPPGTPVSSTNKTDHHDIAEIVLKVALNTITLT